MPSKQPPIKTNLVGTVLLAFLSCMLIHYGGIENGKYNLYDIIRITHVSILIEQTMHAHNYAHAKNFVTLLNCYPSLGTILAVCYLIVFNKTCVLGIK